jgi:hypothetical protein
MQGTEMNRDDEIRQLAYRLWEYEGCPDGREFQHWLKAETIWLEELARQSKPKQRNAPKGSKTKQTQNTKREL